MALLTDALRARIGETVSYTAPEPMGRASFRYFALAVGDDNPLYTDAEQARAAGHRDVVAPPTLVCETNQYVGGRRRDEDGYVGHSWHLEVPGTRLLRGGNRYQFQRPLHPDDVVTATWRIAGITERTSEKGRAMLVVESEATYTAADGALLARNTETLIYQALS